MKITFAKEEKQEMLDMVRIICREAKLYDDYSNIVEAMDSIEAGDVYGSDSLIFKIYQLNDEFVIEYDKEVIVTIIEAINKNISPFIAMGKSLISLIEGMTGFYINLIEGVHHDIIKIIKKKNEDRQAHSFEEEPEPARGNSKETFGEYLDRKNMNKEKYDNFYEEEDSETIPVKEEDEESFIKDVKLEERE